jgi:hypothetical protein
MVGPFVNRSRPKAAERTHVPEIGFVRRKTASSMSSSRLAVK